MGKHIDMHARFRFHNRRPVAINTLLGLAAILLMTGCASSSPIIPSMQRMDIDPHMLQPGLSVYYLRGKWKNVDRMPWATTFVSKGARGKPVTVIDHAFGSGEVYDSGNTRYIGVQMHGYIHLDRAGTWQFQALSNDGVEIYVRDQLVVDDASYHSDRLSEPITYPVDTPGWYPLTVRYFQRKGSAALKFYWQPPGATGFAIVPARAFAHLPDIQ